MGVLEIFGSCPEDILSVSWRYLMSVLEIFDGCTGDIWSVSWWFWSLSWRYL